MRNRTIFMIIFYFFPLMVKAETNNPFPTISRENPRAIIFVSFSMPKQSLAAYLTQAQKIHVPVVIRGLVNNSFKETFAKVAEIVKEAGGGVELNPPLFKQFHIEQVPAVVVLAGNKACAANRFCSGQDFDVMYGNIPLEAALKLLRDRGTVAQHQAGELLNQLRASSHA